MNKVTYYLRDIMKTEKEMANEDEKMYYYIINSIRDEES